MGTSSIEDDEDIEPDKCLIAYRIFRWTLVTLLAPSPDARTSVLTYKKLFPRVISGELPEERFVERYKPKVKR